MIGLEIIEGRKKFGILVFFIEIFFCFLNAGFIFLFCIRFFECCSSFWRDSGFYLEF